MIRIKNYGIGVSICALMLGAPSAHAQAPANTGSLRGVVRDAQQTPLPDATVTITPLAAGSAAAQSADADGQSLYRFEDVPAGQYRLTARHPGFADFVREPVVIIAGTNLVIDIQMNVEDLVETVTVTAQKRGAERLQDVPMSIQAVTAATLTRSGATDALNVSRLAPSIATTDTGTGTYQLSMRGITTGFIPTFTTQENPLVGIYLDEMPIALSNFNPNLDVFDMERVEVLRGPQGTLYGAGSMGGNIRFVTAKPRFDRVEAVVEAGASSVERGGVGYTAKAMVNIPLIENKLGVRLVATRQRTPGVIDNPSRGWDNVDYNDQTGVRAMVRFVPTSRLDISGTLLFQDQSQPIARRLSAAPGTGVMPADRDFTQFRIVKEPFEDRDKMGSVSIAYDLQWAQLYSVSSYFTRKFSNVREVFQPFFVSLGLRTESPALDYWNVNDFAQELRLSSSTGTRFDWVIGAFYDSQRTHFTQSWPVENWDALSGIPSEGYGAPVNNLFIGDVNSARNQIALFGQGSYKLTDRLTGTLGLRWFDWDQDFDLFYAGFFNGGVSRQNAENSSREITPKYTLSYKAGDDDLIYASAGKGFRLGGINDPVPLDVCAGDLAPIGLTTTPRTFTPDSLWNYELGAKTQWLDRRVTVNSTVFYIDWSDIQTTRPLPNCGYSFVENVGDSRSTGLETEVSATPARGLQLSAGLAVTRSELTKDVPNLGGKKGASTPLVPDLSMSVAIDYERPVARNVTAFARLDTQYVGKRYTTFDPLNRRELPAYGIGNATFGIDRHGWQVIASVRNLWNERAVFYEQPAERAYYGAQQVLERPRTFTITTRWQF